MYAIIIYSDDDESERRSKLRDLLLSSEIRTKMNDENAAAAEAELALAHLIPPDKMHFIKDFYNQLYDNSMFFRKLLRPSSFLEFDKAKGKNLS